MAKAKTKARQLSRSPAPVPAACNALLSRDQVAAALGGISPRMLSILLSTGEFPQADLHIGRLPRWKTSTVNAWIEGRSRDAGSQATA